MAFRRSRARRRGTCAARAAIRLLLETIDPRFAVALGELQRSYIFEQRVRACRCEACRELLARIDETRWRDRFDPRRARRARSEEIFATEDGIRGTKHRPRVQRGPQRHRIGEPLP